MALNLERLRALDLPAIEQAVEIRDTILYALGLGYGTGAGELPFVYEKQLRTVPSICCVLAHPGFWLRRPEFGADWVRLLHAEQEFEIHNPIPPEGRVRGVYSVSGLEDKGPDRGALLHQIKELSDAESGARLATVRSTLFLRGDGGVGGFGTSVAAPEPLPDRAPDRVLDILTLPQQALIYRLSGDWNPLHADPEIAHEAGFSAPILQGLCTNGIACRGVLSAYCDNDPARLRAMFVRFSKPLMPGETVRLEFFEEGARVRFRARALERDVIVLDRASATLA